MGDYPRPPRLQWDDREITVTFTGTLILRAPGAWKVMETFHPPSYYLAPDAFLPSVIRPGTPRRSLCEWKGRARYWTIVAGGRVAEDCGWSYPYPAMPFVDLADCIALFAGRMDRCTLGGEVVIPQPGGFYGGWITPDLEGPFKGEPGTEYW